MGTPRENCPYCGRDWPKATLEIHIRVCPEHPDNKRRAKKNKGK